MRLLWTAKAQTDLWRIEDDIDIDTPDPAERIESAMMQAVHRLASRSSGRSVRADSANWPGRAIAT
jgi:plasmid stabilization system protein ParE